MFIPNSGSKQHLTAADKPFPGSSMKASFAFDTDKLIHIGSISSQNLTFPTSSAKMSCSEIGQSRSSFSSWVYSDGLRGEGMLGLDLS